MSVAAIGGAAVLLAVERAVYAVIARAPGAFLALCARLAPAARGGPIAIVARLFYAFKVLQIMVFAAWCLVYGNGSLAPAHEGPIVLGIAAALVVVGQFLVIATFYRLGRTGVFFGDRFGYEVRHCRAFPFSLLAHPQYVGTMLTIWGVFLALRFPHADWYVLPAVETVYYAAATWLESPRRSAQGLRKRIVPM